MRKAIRSGWLGTVVVCLSAGAQGCSSDSRSAAIDASGNVASDGSALPDAGSDVASDVAASDAGTPDDASGDVGDGNACALTDANAATVEGGAGWACYEGACASVLAACAADCVCNDTILWALLCTADGGSSNTCFSDAIGAHIDDRNVVLVGNCLVFNAASVCGKQGDAGDSGSVNGSPPDADDGQAAEAAADSGSDVGTDSSEDATIDAFPPATADAGAGPDAESVD